MTTETKYNEAKIRELVEQNPYLNTRQLAEKAQLNATVLSRVIKQYNIPYNPYSIYSVRNPDSLMTLLAFIKKNKHYTNKRISSITGVCKNTIADLRKKYNIPHPEDAKLMNMSSVDKIKQIKNKIEEHPEATIAELAVMLNMSYTSVATFIINYNIPYEYKNDTNSFDSMVAPEYMQQIIDDHPDWTQDKLAQYFDVSHNTIRRFIQNHNIRYKPKGRQPSLKSKLTKDVIINLIKRYPHWKRKDYAQHLGIAPSTFNMYVRRYKIDLMNIQKKATSL